MLAAWFSWIEEHPLGEAATVSAAAGISLEEALVAYGADPLRTCPAPPEDRRRPGMPWVDGGAVLVVAVGDGVVGVEPNGWEASRPEVLRRLSAGGRAASWYYNVNAVRRLGIAEAGHMLVDFEPGIDTTPADPVVTTALEGLDIDDWRNGWGLEVLRRAVGHSLTREVFDRMLATGIRYPIVPHLEDLRPRSRRPDGSPIPYGEHGPLGPDTDELLEPLTEEQLRELAWWIADEVASHFGGAGDPEVLTTLAARALSTRAEWMARTGTRSDGGPICDPRVWDCLRHATNPDAYAAVTSNLVLAAYLFRVADGADASGWTERARAQLGWRRQGRRYS